MTTPRRLRPEWERARWDTRTRMALWRLRLVTEHNRPVVHAFSYSVPASKNPRGNR